MGYLKTLLDKDAKLTERGTEIHKTIQYKSIVVRDILISLFCLEVLFSRRGNLICALTHQHRQIRLNFLPNQLTRFM